MTTSWMIYGATGYTGGLIARAAKSRGLDPVLAGRSATELREMGAELGLSHRAFSLDDPQVVDSGLSGVGVLLNCAGPFSATAEPLISACLRNRVHYLDITGELDVFALAERYDEQARAAGVVLCPGVGFDVIPTDCLAAKLADSLPDATQLALAVNPRTTLSPGTAKSILEGVGLGALVLADGEVTAAGMPWPSRRIDFGDGAARTAMAIPLGDLITAHRTTAIPDIATYVAVPSAMVRLARWTTRAQRLASTRGVQSTGRCLVESFVRGPGEVKRRGHSAQVWGEAVNAAGSRVMATITTAGPYDLTVHGALAAVDQLPPGSGRSGVLTPSQLLGSEAVKDFPGSSGFTITRDDTTASAASPTGLQSRTVVVRRVIDAPMDEVFHATTDIRTYDDLPWIRRARITMPMRAEDGQLGAHRTIDLGLLGFREEITGWEPPYRMDYRIRRSWPIRIADQHGTMSFRQLPRGTEVTWTSTFRVALPVVGGLVSRLAAGPVKLLFGNVLRHAARRLSRA